MGRGLIKIMRKSKDFFDLPLQKKQHSSVDFSSVSSAGRYSIFAGPEELAELKCVGAVN